jgi:hypothetical protein
MDHDKNLKLDKLLERTSVSALKSLDAVVDVEQRLRDFYREVGLDPEFVQDDSASN